MGVLSPQHGSRGESVVVAVDVGGTTIKGAAFDARGTVLERRTVPTYGPEASPLAATSALITHLLDAVAGLGRPVEGIGIASPGMVDSVAGTVTFAANLGWTDLAIVEVLTDRFELPVALDHDARAAARAERAARIAAGDDGDDFLFVPIGTGISAAIVTGGVIVTGASGGAGEFGHVPVVPGGESCVCGQRGCVEVYASAGAIVRRYRAAGGELRGGAREIAAAIDTDPTAAGVWDDAVAALAVGLTGLTAVLDPAALVIGGGLGEAGDRLLTPLRQGIESRLAWRKPPLVERSRVGVDAGLIGASLLFESQPGRPLSPSSPRVIPSLSKELP